MSGAEAHPPPPPPPPPHGAGHHPHPMQGEWASFTRSPNGQHYYTYVTKYRRCGGRWGTGFVVGGLTGMLVASCWQRRHLEQHPDASFWCRGSPWERRHEHAEKQAKPEDITNQ